MDWARTNRNITSKETSFGVGKFEPMHTPYMEYVYDCLDNPWIPYITAQKSTRVAWTETINNYRGKRIHTNPCNMLLGFATKEASRLFAKYKWTNFVKNVPVLRNLINIGVAKNKESFFDFSFPNGSLRFVTLGSIVNQKSDNFPYIEIEEPDDAKDEVAGQGDTLSNLKQRQKTVPTTMKKLIFGGTPTNKDFSRVEKATKASNQLVFKAECHSCKELIAMDGKAFDNIKYDEWEDRKIHPTYGKYNPYSARFECPCCLTEWSFEQKNLNIIAGKAYGFTDHTGNFSKGWHPKDPSNTEIFGFIFSELLSPFEASNFVELTKIKILADIEKSKGNEALMKSYYNNNRGEPYASGFSAMEVEEMIKLRSNYPQHIAPGDVRVITMGIDVQHNRFALVILGWGRNGNVWLITWKEIFGNVFNPTDSVWQELTDICYTDIPSAIPNKVLPITAISIDSGDGGTVELVYKWVSTMNLDPRFNGEVRATKGVRNLKFSTDDIYKQPNIPNLIGNVGMLNMQRTLAEKLGVTVYQLGAHRAHDEVLRRLSLNAVDKCNHDVFYFNEQSYGNFEEQILSCRKLIDVTGNSTKEFYQLVSGKRKEAMDCCKNAFHAAYAINIRDFSEDKFQAIERYLGLRN